MADRMVVRDGVVWVYDENDVCKGIARTLRGIVSEVDVTIPNVALPAEGLPVKI